MVGKEFRPALTKRTSLRYRGLYECQYPPVPDTEQKARPRPQKMEKTMPSIRDRLNQLNLTLPKPVKPVASYIPAVSTTPGARLVFIAGQIPMREGALIAAGSVPNTVSLEQAQECAKQCVLNGLAALEAEIGDLARVKRVIRVGVFVACEHGFTEHPKVANGASELLVQLLGDPGKHARAAVGCPSLPLGAPVEVEFVFEVE